MRGTRFIALTVLLLIGIVFVHTGYAQVGAQVSASARQICSTSVSHELDIRWSVSGTSAAVQVTIVITGPDGKTQSFTDNQVQGSRKVNVNYPNGGTANVRMTARASNQVATDTAAVSLLACLRIQVSFTAQAVCGTAFSHQGVINWLVSSARDANIVISVIGPDGKTQSLTDNRVQGSRTVNLNYPEGGGVTVRVTAQTSTGIQVTGTATAVLTPCPRLQISATPKSVCNSAGSHELEIRVAVMGIRPGSRVIVVIVVTGPDGKQQTQNQQDVSTAARFSLFYPSGGIVQIQITAQTENGTATNATRVSLPPCDQPGKTIFIPPGFGPGLTVPETPDFVITDIEVSQGVQNMDNEMPLVARRWTIVRVYVKDLKNIGAGNVGAKLSGELVEYSYTVSQGGGGGSAQISLGTLNPSNKNGGKITVQPDGGERRNLNDSFWFRIPFSWHEAAKSLISQGTTLSSFKIKFTAEVNPNGPGSISETKKAFP